MQALERKPWDRYVQIKAESTFLTQNALPSPTLAPSSPHDDGPGLWMAALGGNISPEKPVIRWISVHWSMWPSRPLEVVAP